MLSFAAESPSKNVLVKIHKHAQFAPLKLGAIDLYHHNGQFLIKHDNKVAWDRLQE